jgi:dTMP kinase
MNHGILIVLEGVDGAGTTTQCHCLQERLREQGVAAEVTREPSNGPMGMLLRLVLSGRLTGAGDAGAPSWSTLALMFAADRLDHLENEVVPLLGDGTQVICDRYYHSSIAYQSCTGGSSAADRDWIKQINSRARRPDLTIVLDVSERVARDRRSGRLKAELYEQPVLQKRLCDFYRELERYVEDEAIAHVDGDVALPMVTEAIWALVEPLVRKGKKVL